MTDTLKSVTSAGSGKGNPLTNVAQSEAADRLKSEVQEYLAVQAQRLLTGVGKRLGETTVKLNDIADGNSPGFAKLALDGGRKLAEGKGPLRSALEVGAGRAKDGVVGAFKNLTGGKGKRKGGAGKKPTVVIEFIDVGVPLRTAYDQWTQYQDFSTFAKGVKSANRADDTTSDWQLKVFWSNRSWKAHTTEQVPDHRISWTSEGAKGTTKGVVTFHELAPNLTRVLLVIEYYPKGLFEKTGNLWRAQGRRTRLDLKNFARFITLKGETDDGWRGEIRDGEVVRSHEDAIAEEEENARAEAEGQEGEEEDEAEYEDADDEAEPAEPEGDFEEADDEKPEDAEYEDELDGDDQEAAYEDELDDGDDEAAYEDEPEPEGAEEEAESAPRTRSRR
ncbi:SRPBCC family protein [Streptomyces sp. ME02-8801-2C]|uniref:SRPBCC family protein n=1 Tax=Streptomyces sp. ME02-8801-2C TaxID=3028680 RepID=UPI0029AC6BC6|nr:SRPBCC family protein [Streptomyces sp. ME02-8801-2C]MDX3451362.1 SRPBCC family protein [Streptomyces sp. ME02-8801-2C]